MHRKQSYIDSLSGADRKVLEELEPTAFSLSLTSLPEDVENPSDTQATSETGYTVLESQELLEALPKCCVVTLCVAAGQRRRQRPGEACGCLAAPCRSGSRP